VRRTACQTAPAFSIFSDKDRGRSEAAFLGMRGCSFSMASLGRLVDGTKSSALISSKVDLGKGGMYGDLRLVDYKRCRFGRAFSSQNPQVTPIARFVH